MKLRAFVTAGCLTAGLFVPIHAAPPAETPFSSCERPIATCDRPRPSCVAETLRTAGIAPAKAPTRPEDAALRLPSLPERSTPYFKTYETEPVHKLRPVPERRIHDARAVLLQWQAATKSRLPATEADRMWLAHEQPGLSHFERELACELQGPVDAKALGGRFDWSVVEKGGSLLLIGVPRGVLDHLLCDRVEVWLDENRQMTTLAFPGQDAGQRGWIVFNETEHSAAKITPASYESKSSEPARLRTAEIENATELKRPEPRLVREPSELSLPMAPTDGPLGGGGSGETGDRGKDLLGD